MAAFTPTDPVARFQFRFAGKQGKSAALEFLQGHRGTPGIGSAISRFSGSKPVWDVTEEAVYFPLFVLLAERGHGSLRRNQVKMPPTSLGALALRVLGPKRRVFTNEDVLDLPSRIDFAAEIGGVNAGAALVL
jgi:hypothetical protein